MTDIHHAYVLRYRRAQRIVHWMGVGSFLLLLLSGLVLVVPALSFLAAGGASRMLHRVGAIGFLLMPVVYTLLMPHEALALLRESFSYRRRDLAWFRHMPAYVLGSTRHLPPAGHLNPGQKIHHALTLITGVTVAASGLALWFGQAALGPDGLALALSVHDLSMMALTVLMIGHMYFTFLYGALPAMTSGYVSADYARLEHADWYRSLSPAVAAAEGEDQPAA